MKGKAFFPFIDQRRALIKVGFSSRRRQKQATPERSTPPDVSADENDADVDDFESFSVDSWRENGLKRFMVRLRNSSAKLTGENISLKNLRTA